MMDLAITKKDFSFGWRILTNIRPLIKAELWSFNDCWLLIYEKEITNKYGEIRKIRLW